jgi:multiple sugar transport system ATP-binding protein
VAEIAFIGVTKRFGDTVAVDDLDLEIQDGEFMILVGPSGCGKTTALRLLAGLEAVTQGEIRIDGEVINERTPKERDIAMVFQSYALYPHMSVSKNLAFALKRARLPKDEIEKRVEHAAGLLGISELLDRKPATLSGGQRQRVAMGRAIVRDPKAYLMDEPLSNLDAKLRIQMRAELTRIQRRLNTTTVYVTHDQIEAMTLGDRVAVMRAGKLLQVGTPSELYHRPRDLFVAGFIGAPAMNFLPAEVEDDSVRTSITSIPLNDELRARLNGRGTERRVIVGIRPEDVEDAALVQEHREGHMFSAVVDVIEETGSDTYAHLAYDAREGETEILRSLGDGAAAEAEAVETPSFVVRLNAGSELREGESERLWLNTAAVHLFDTQTGERIAAAEEATASAEAGASELPAPSRA